MQVSLKIVSQNVIIIIICKAVIVEIKDKRKCFAINNNLFFLLMRGQYHKKRLTLDFGRVYLLTFITML